MKTHLAIAGVALILGTQANGADLPKIDTAPPARDATSPPADAIKLCDRLAGMEREICMQQALENQRLSMEPPIGATPGAPGAGMAAPETAKPKR